MNNLKDTFEEAKVFSKFHHSRIPFFEIAYEYFKNSSRILDLGSGRGIFIDFLNEKGFKGEIYAYDRNKETLKNLKKKGIKAKYGILPEIKFKDDFFDGINASHILEHLYPEELYETLREIKRVLKKNGILVISGPLLWEDFYSDLSHIRPYNPGVFIKYLCEDKSENPSHPLVKGFELVKIIYRYRFVGINPLCFKHSTLFNFLSLLFFKFLRKIGIGHYEKTGYTIILRKV